MTKAGDLSETGEGGQDRMNRALLSQAHRNSFATMAVQASAAIGVTLVAQSQDRPFYVGWLTITLVVLALRTLCERWLGRALAGRSQPLPLTALAWGQRLGLILSAGLWALLACLKIPEESLTTRYVIIIVLSALAGGAVGVLSPLKWTGRIYVSLILLPASLTLVLADGADRALGLLGMVFWGVMMVGHKNNHALLVDAIRLRDENRELLENVERRNLEISAMNRELEERVRARTQDLERLSEDAQAANRAKSQFLATVSHEMRTPLNAIMGEGQLLDREALADAPRRRVDVMKTASRALRQLIDDVLDISQIEAGGFELRNRDFAMAGLADDVRDLYAATARDGGLALTITLSPDAPAFRHGDEDRLRQIVCNLVSNALKFTPQGGVTVEIGGDAETLVLTVSDTGVGIDPASQEIIFQRFVQLDGSSTRTTGGVGLGLAICRELAGRMNGSLSVTSTPGQGSRFELVAPMPAVEGGTLETSTQNVAPSGRDASAALLIVDDNAANRRILAALAEPFGVECGFASNGDEAIQAWRSQTWDAILMDVHMPVKDGIEATRIIRQEEAERGLARIPIIAVTASVLNHEAAAYRDVGMDDLLPKPVEAAELAALLIRHLTPPSQAA